MLPIGGLIGRLVNAVLYAVIVLVVLLIIAVVVAHFDQAIADIINKFAYVIALLCGLVVFFIGGRHTPLV